MANSIRFDTIFDEMICKVKQRTSKSKLPYGFGPCEYPLELNRLRLIQLLRRHGRTPNQIAGFMNGAGQPRRVGEGIWDDRHIRYLLRKNPVSMDLKGKKLPADLHETLGLLGLDDAVGKES